MSTITYKGMVGKYKLHSDGADGMSYYAGSIPGIAEAVVLFEGETKEEMLEDFRNAVEDCLQQGYQQNYEISQRITIPASLYASLQARAASAGVSLSSFTRRALASII